MLKRERGSSKVWAIFQASLKGQVQRSEKTYTGIHRPQAAGKCLPLRAQLPTPLLAPKVWPPLSLSSSFPELQTPEASQKTRRPCPHARQAALDLKG